jgi:Asp-tRNA(Asn)/Glu-tRNA(Gln) amidotransferase A subunit family amidase
MPTTRREFLGRAVAGIAGVAAAAKADERAPDAGTADAGTPGAPPAFGTSPSVGPEVGPGTFAEAEKLVQVTNTPDYRAQAAANWRESMAALYERRTGPKKIALEETLAPATLWNPAIPGATVAKKRGRFAQGTTNPENFSENEDDIAYATVAQQAGWIKSRRLTSTRLTQIYLDRLERFDPQLKCVITLTKDHALEQAMKADREIASGKYRGPLHGIPWGVKDLVDTKGIRTTYGAEPFRNRVPNQDAAIVRKLNDAGAVLVAKLSLGALALNDIWFGGQTLNPWLLAEGASGSSAGPGAATAAGLVGFSVGSETLGSIVAPSMRCGVTGLRPTFGRVARTGAMTLCWSLDKLGPMARGVLDTLLVLQAISGADPGDLYSVPSDLEFDAAQPVKGLRIGYVPRWMNDASATPVDRKALEVARQVGMQPVEVDIPDWPYGSLVLVLFAEAAAAFEEITLDRRLDELKMQVLDAWPNSFRQSRFLSAVDYVQADRLRRKVAQQMARVFSGVDLLLVPSFSDMLTIGNFTGHPSLTLRAGFVEVSEPRSDWAPDPKNPLPKLPKPVRVPHGVTLVGKLFDEGTLGRAGMALERAFNVAQERPPGFAHA